MLGKPDIPDAAIAACLREQYGLSIGGVSFLPLGADRASAAYRVFGNNQAHYFLKLKLGGFDETAVALPKFLSDRGIRQIIAPLATESGALWTSLGRATAILYPFVDGRNGYEVTMSDAHWVALGAALRRVHEATLPVPLAERIQKETYSAEWRERVLRHLDRIDAYSHADETAAQLAQLLRVRQRALRVLVRRADRLAEVVQAHPAQAVLCHADVHAGNVLIDARGGLFVVDWDNPVLAPRERDLMFAGGGLFGAARTPHEEEALFFRGYGQTSVDQIALAYFRYERIVQDVALFCDQIVSTASGDLDRVQALKYLASNFDPGGTLEIATRSDTRRGVA